MTILDSNGFTHVPSAEEALSLDPSIEAWILNCRAGQTKPDKKPVSQ